MKHPAKKLLCVMFAGCMLMSSTIITGNAANTSPNIAFSKTPILLASALQHNVLETISAMQIQPYSVLKEWNLDTGSRGTDETPKFTMEKGEGLYLCWDCEVPQNSEPVHVYLYDIGKGEIVSAMSPQMNPGEKRQEVFYVGSDSSVGQFRIKIESTTGGTAYATVHATQTVHTSASKKQK